MACEHNRCIRESEKAHSKSIALAIMQLNAVRAEACLASFPDYLICVEGAKAFFCGLV